MNRRYSGKFYDDFPATAGLLLVIIGFFILEVILQSKISDPVGGGGGLSRILSIQGDVAYILGSSNTRSIIRDGEIWRLIAACFLHGGLFHLFMNSYVLMDLGRTCEPLLGFRRFISSYVICGVGASLASVGYHYFNGQMFSQSVGASEALAGLIGLLLAFSIRHKDHTLRAQLIRWILFIALITFFIPRIDHVGHVGGLVTGFALGWFVPRYTSSEISKRWKIPAWIAMAICAVGLGMSVWGMFQELMKLGDH